MANDLKSGGPLLCPEKDSTVSHSGNSSFWATQYTEGGKQLVIQVPERKTMVQTSGEPLAAEHSTDREKLQGQLRVLELQLSRNTGNPSGLPRPAEFVSETEEECRELPNLQWCARCRRESTSEAQFFPDSQTFWSSVGIFLLGGVFGCFLLPYMTSQCQSYKLICRNCKSPVN